MENYYHKLMGTSQSTTRTEKVYYEASGASVLFGDRIKAAVLKGWHTVQDGVEEIGLRFTGAEIHASTDGYTDLSIYWHNAEAKIKSVIQPERGTLYGEGSIGYYVLSGSITHRDPVNNLGSVTFSGNIGAGAHVETGVQNGKIKMSAGASAGVGGGVSIDLDLKNTWNGFRQAFSQIGTELNDLDNKLIAFFNQ